jgi:hypothetical protein
MKRVGLWATIGIGIFITVGLLTVKPGYAKEKEREPMCSNKTITGEYGFSYSGQILEFGPIVGVAMFSFDGHGNVSLLDHTLINGVPQSAPFARFSSGTYTVNEDCTGVFVINFTDGTPPLNASMLVLDGGREIRDVVSDAGTAITAVGVRRDSSR